jgi:hypothetical protein
MRLLRQLLWLIALRTYLQPHLRQSSLASICELVGKNFVTQNP